MNLVVDFHPPTSLKTFVSSILQLDGYPNAMPLHVALQQQDKDKFAEAVQWELKQHTELKHWKVVNQSQVPRNSNPIPLVWLNFTNEMKLVISSNGMHICVLGVIYGDTYWTTFARVFSWTTACCVFILALLLVWHMSSIDFIMVYIQAKVKNRYLHEVAYRHYTTKCGPSQTLTQVTTKSLWFKRWPSHPA